MKDIILIDNYDSFTYNLLHYIAELGARVEVFRNDAISVDELLSLNADGIVISPGPSTPDNAGICLDVIKRLAADGHKHSTAVLGVCLGHQTIGQAFGGKIVRSEPVHGKTSSIYHGEKIGCRLGKTVFSSLPSPFTATRYHSLVIEWDSLPECLEITAKTDDDIIMGVQHKELNIHGVQFHPESIASEYGHDIIRNFLNLI